MTTKINVIYGAIITALAAVFGKYWFLFAGFLVLNLVDYATGCAYAKWYAKTISSAAGAKGIMKKVSYWVVIGIAFFVANTFVQMGEAIDLNLSFVILFGWLTLASYIVNEIRSILENLIKMNVKVPKFLTQGLEIAEKVIERRADETLVDEGREE